VKRLRTLRFRYWVMPVILAALAARAFMPAGFMTTTADGAAALRITMCSQDKLQRENIVIPDEQQAPAHHGLDCKFCGAPIMGTPFASFDLVTPAPAPLLAAASETRPSYAPLLRSQTARAPPQA
jgi:hypothetical protein